MKPARPSRMRVVHRWGAALVALAGLVSACLGPTDPLETQGQLRARAAFEAGTEPSVLGVSVDSVRAVVSRSDGAVVSDRVRPDPGEGGELSWLLELAASEETFHVALELRSGGVVMYSGEDDATVTEGALGQAGVHDVLVRYVGPTPRVTRVEVTPDRLALSAVGARGELSAVAFDTNGDPVPRAVSWRSVDVAVATVDTDGVVIATGAGSTLVIAEIDGVADTAQILVDPTLAKATTITADPTTIEADGESTSTILVEVRDKSGNLVGASAGEVELQTTLGTLGGVTDHGDGTYTATLTSETTLGTAVVSGTLAGVAIEDTAEVEFGPGPVDPKATTITADPTTIEADGESTSTILVEVRDKSGNLVGASAGEVELQTTLGTLGGVSDHGDGTYTATLTSETTLGTAVVSGTLAGVAIEDTAEVEFGPGPVDPKATTITADPTTIEADGESTSTILVEVRDKSGNLVGASAGEVELQTTLGTLGGVSDHGDGTYTATLTSETTLGTAVVSGTLAGVAIEDTAEVEFGKRRCGGSDEDDDHDGPDEDGDHGGSDDDDRCGSDDDDDHDGPDEDDDHDGHDEDDPAGPAGRVR